MGTYEGKTVNVVWDTPGANVWVYSALATDDLIQGYGGGDTIYGNSRDNYIFGDQRGDRSDFDLALDGADTLYGFGGNDLLNPGSGSGNYVDGGTGTDTLDYRDATPGQTVTIDMEDGVATAGTYGSTGFVGIENVLGSENGPNVIYGDAADNEIHGGDFDDDLKGRDGKDSIFGYDGHDLLRGNAGNDLIKGGNGNDTIYGGKGSDRLVGGKGGDKILGDKGGDTLIGANGGDLLLGKNGNDKIDGGSGKDELVGGSGSDTLTGGDGADKFVFYNSPDADKIMDFEAKDTISIGSGANNYSQLKITDTNAGLLIEFGRAEVFLKGIDIGDIDKSNFDFF